MKKLTPDRLLAVLCWLGLAISTTLLFYMLRTAERFPEIGQLARNARIAGVLVLVWLPAAVYFTVRAHRGGKKK